MKSRRNFQRLMASVYGIVVLCAAFALYVKTLAPTVSFFDSGELIAAAATFGVAHPPGYPLYVALGWLFSHLPVGSVAYRLNLMSAVFAAFAALMAYLVTYLVLKENTRQAEPAETPCPEQMLSPALALIAGLTFACSLTPWRQALSAEVYALNACLCGSIVALLLLWRRSQARPDLTPNPSPKERGDSLPVGEGRGGVCRLWLLYLVAYLFGVGFGNHQTIILFSIPAALLVLATAPRILRRPLPLALIALCFGLGLTIYGVIPLRAAANPPLNWGHATNWAQFRWLVLREGYKNVPRGEALPTLWNDLLGREPKPKPADEFGEFQPPQVWRSKERGLARMVDVFTHSLFFRQLQTVTLLQQFGAVGVMLIVFGVCYGLWKYPIPAAMLVIGIVSFVLIVVLIGDPPDENVFLVEEFHTPIYLLFAALMGLGMMAAARGLLWLAAPFGRSWQYGAVFGVAMTFLMVPASLMLGNFKSVDSSRNYVAYDYASNVFASLPSNAIIFTWGDSGAFPLWYLQIVEGVRPDVTVIHVPHLSLFWYRDELPKEFFLEPPADEDDIIEYVLQIVETQMWKRPIYFDYSSVHSLELPLQFILNGVTYKVEMPGDALDENVWMRYQFRGILDDTPIAMDPDTERVITIYGAAQIQLGQYYMEKGETAKAAQAFNNAVKFDPSLGDAIVKELHFRNKLATEPPQ